MRKLPREGTPFDPVLLALHELIVRSKPAGATIAEHRPSPVHLRLDITVDCAYRPDGTPMQYFVQAERGGLSVVDPQYDREDHFECTLADPDVIEKMWGFVMTPWPAQRLFNFMNQ